MFPVFSRALAAARIFPLAPNLTSNFHIFSGSADLLLRNRFLSPIVPSVTQTCGFKVKGHPHRRCKDCFMVWREERLYVLCKTHPRHKQMSMVKSPKNSWILSHATQGKMRPW